MKMQLSDYILECDISDACIEDIAIQEAYAELSVMTALVDGYRKAMLIQEYCCRKQPDASAEVIQESLSYFPVWQEGWVQEAVMKGKSLLNKPNEVGGGWTQNDPRGQQKSAVPTKRNPEGVVGGETEAQTAPIKDRWYVAIGKLLKSLLTKFVNLIKRLFTKEGHLNAAIDKLPDDAALKFPVTVAQYTKIVEGVINNTEKLVSNLKEGKVGKAHFNNLDFSVEKMDGLHIVNVSKDDLKTFMAYVADNKRNTKVSAILKEANFSKINFNEHTTDSSMTSDAIKKVVDDAAKAWLTINANTLKMVNETLKIFKKHGKVHTAVKKIEDERKAA
jgi:hypothetical protein